MKQLVAIRREMRAKRDAVIRKGPIAFIDIGSHKLGVMIAQFMAGEEEEHMIPSFRILAAAEFASQGVQYGEISSLPQLQAQLLHALQTVQRRARVRTDYAAVCFAGGTPQSYGVSGETVVHNGEVGNACIGSAMSACEFPELPIDREFLHAMPVNFTLDHRTGLHDPRGQIGARLSVDMHLLSVDRGPLENIKQIIRHADMEVIALSTSPYMSGLSVLTEDEQNLGSVVIDFGAMTTSIAAFFRKQLIYVRNIRMGGGHVTDDITYALGVPFQEAEKLKCMYGGVEATAADDRETLSLEGDHYENRRYITRAELIGIIRPRLEETFEEITRALEEAGLNSLPSQSIVITGGASQIPGLDGLAERYLGRRVRYGRNIHLAGAASPQAQPNFAALTGLALNTAQPKDELWDFECFNPNPHNLNFRGMFKWFRQNW